jgi:fructosamine-3-kinase
MNEEFQHEIGYESITRMWSKAFRTIFVDQRAFTSLQIHLKRNPFSPYL